ncbi:MULTISPECIES: acyl-CoA thioesterase [Pontibacillus]|uniref:Thioesterase family protein n=1 Tax=Pontibacillus chungwhensis TaxID=265426 RepID=A0ABY8UXK9_9BACI|nr:MULTISPECIES: thioesterase family protein [Pontibacillus]MCD5323771.1 acyl-CoA thioesterase [Pontibacillus sp. HN14]WIF97135.1 thioesterase family protein [Pontibacillus chungwhensis]
MKRVSYVEDSKKWLEEFTFSIKTKVRFSETDLFGHMNNTVPFTYFEEARIEFLKSVGAFQVETDDSNSIPVAADLQCDYHKQVFFDDVLSVAVKINYVGNTSYDLHYLVRNKEGDVCLTGRGRIVQIDAGSGKPVSIPREILNAYELSPSVAKG